MHNFMADPHFSPSFDYGLENAAAIVSCIECPAKIPHSGIFCRRLKPAATNKDTPPLGAGRIHYWFDNL
jgi:hypothetical protein